MAAMLIVLVPLAILFAWAVVHDLKRRRRHAAAGTPLYSPQHSTRQPTARREGDLSTPGRSS